MTSTKEHNNWLTVGEIIYLIKKPIASYADNIVNAHHANLLAKLGPGLCTTPAHCLKKKKPKDLCVVCQAWYTELESTHRKGDKKTIKWRENCDTSKWLHDEWEMAKFYMSLLGDNKTNVQNAETTDLSSLLNLLEWMKDTVFGGGSKRVNINLVRKLRSDVRNSWAHNAKQEMKDAQRKDCFQIASDFLKDLDNVASTVDIKTSIRDIDNLKANGILNVSETEHRNFVLQSSELSADLNELKKELQNMKDEQDCSYNRTEELNRKIEDLEIALENCHFKIEELKDCVKTLETEASFPKTRLPDKISNFIGRETEVSDVCSFVKEEHGIVSICGGPGFGKSSIAIHVSHRLHDRHGYPVIFSFLSSVVSVEEATRRLCLVLGIGLDEDPLSALIMWLINIKKRAIIVMDNVEQLLEGEKKPKFVDLLQCLRKNSDRQLQIITTSTKTIEDPALEVKARVVKPLDEVSSVELLKMRCPEREFQEGVLSSMADLCGRVPLALRLLAFRLKNEEDPDIVVKWLETSPMAVLDEKVQQVIKKSFEMVQKEDVKKCFVRLAVFGCNFDREAAQIILEKDDIGTQNVLNELKERSLLQQSGLNYSIHRLIQCFLIGLPEFLNEIELGERLIVDHFLNECQDFMKIYWSKNGGQGACQKMQRNSRYIERMVNICKEAAGRMKPNDTVIVRLRDIITYHSYSIAFHDFLKHTWSSQLVTEFLECCLKVAIQQKDELGRINFLCNLSNIKGHAKGWASKEYGKSMEATKEAARRLEDGTLPDAGNVLSRYWLACTRYYQSSLQKVNLNKKERFQEAKTCLDRSQKSRRPTEDFRDKVYEVFALMHRARIHKGTGEYEASRKLYHEAMEKSEEYFGSHLLTIDCYKVLGDLYLMKKGSQEALDCYDKAKKMHNELVIGPSSVSLVYLLKNRAYSLFYLDRHDEAKAEILKACEMVKNFTDNTDCSGKVYETLARILDSAPKACSEAAECASKAICKKN